MGPRRRPVVTRRPPSCPEAAGHTPHPAGYIGHASWAEQMLQTHVQRVCSGCGGWEIWIPKDPSVLYAPALADQDCACCGAFIDEGDPMRTDDDGGWLCASCHPGHPATPAHPRRTEQP